ncbi:hypothetical protein NKH82_17745 [Mesorhizobium sp. M0915]|uniref:hypothetical protein n=1 Tax=Mesorhizobium sp. M0915 TaxID=2957027 RepID=UPI003337FFCD
MNLRTLKKLSKRAAPLLPLLGDRREQFRAEHHANGNNFIGGTLIMARKHWERGRSVHGDCIRQHEVKRPARDGRGWIYMAPPDHPRKGTIMVGAMSGYYEPEWDEETVWTALESIVSCHFTDWHPEHDGTPTLLRRLSTPRDVLLAARDMAAELAVPA